MGSLMCLAGIGLVCLFLASLLVLFSIFGLRFWRLGGIRYPQTCVQDTLRSGRPFGDFSGTLRLLNTNHVGERDEALLRTVLVG